MNRFFLAAFALFMTVNSQAQVAKVVDGIMIDERTENPIKEVNLKLKNLENSKEFLAETDEYGKFEFKNIPLGNYEFIVDDKDYLRTNSFNIELTEDHLEHFTFGEPIIAKLKVSWLFNWGDRTTTDAAGNTQVKEHYWSHLTAKIVLTIYGLCLLLIFFYSVLQLSLAIAYVRNKKKKEITQKPIYDPATTPKVTVQLPMYNELYVAERIIETIAQFDYPSDKLQIQVLDDSTDETKDVIAKKVAEVAARGINIQHIHRVDRTGYKAGALDAAMDQVESEFIAIFDADFIPDADWLQKTMPYFQNENIGVVQTRWGHINKDYSLLTELQAFGLNGHFAIEQGGRNSAGHFINFNGTGGIWRKKCIEDAGGWEHDTLTEDLDLS